MILLQGSYMEKFNNETLNLQFTIEFTGIAVKQITSKY